ncbi:hypothetical protein [Rhodococcus koreensis]
MTTLSPRHPLAERIPNPHPDRHPSRTDLADVDETLTAGRRRPRPGAENDPRVP